MMELLDDEEAFVSLLNDLHREVVALAEDDEWVPSGEVVPLHVFASGPSRAMLFCPKPYVLHEASVVSARCTIVGRFGVVTPAERLLLERAGGGASLFFVGDLDPLDLTAFVGLRGAAQQVHYMGLGGVIFEQMDASGDWVRSLPMSKFEQWHWQKLLYACPNIRSLIG